MNIIAALLLFLSLQLIFLLIFASGIWIEMRKNREETEEIYSCLFTFYEKVSDYINWGGGK